MLDDQEDQAKFIRETGNGPTVQEEDELIRLAFHEEYDDDVD